MLNNVKKKIIENDYVNNVRINMVFNDEQYNDLVSGLEELANLLKNNRLTRYQSNDSVFLFLFLFRV